MKELNWGDTLCGHKVEPYRWCGGVTLNVNKGLWWIQPTEGYTPSFKEAFTPIYPPRGWKGLSEEEIWEAFYPYNL